MIPLLNTTINLGQKAIDESVPGVVAADITDPQGALGRFLNRFLEIILAIAVLLVFGYLIMGAIDWVTSGGDKGKTEKARDKMTGAVIGLIVLGCVTGIMMLVQRFLDVTILNFVPGP